jgi:hypothetical protein
MNVNKKCSKMIFWKLIKSIKKKVKVVVHSVEGRVLTFSPNVFGLGEVAEPKAK